jgi:Holliday junction resolvase RusA-like endonuclease
MTDPVTVILLGEPVSWARPRPRPDGGYINPQKQRDNTTALQVVAIQEMAGRPPFDCPLRMDIEAQFAIPKSWSFRRRQRALRGEERPAKKPDLSNCIKQVEDALNNIVFRDDALIVEYGRARKVYSDQPKIVVTIQPIAPPYSALIRGVTDLADDVLDEMIDAEAAR